MNVEIDCVTFLLQARTCYRNRTLSFIRYKLKAKLLFIYISLAILGSEWMTGSEILDYDYIIQQFTQIKSDIYWYYLTYLLLE